MEHKCLYCKYEWDSRKENPKACPKCKRYIIEDKKMEEQNGRGDNTETNTQ